MFSFSWFAQEYMALKCRLVCSMRSNATTSAAAEGRDVHIHVKDFCNKNKAVFFLFKITDDQMVLLKFKLNL